MASSTRLTLLTYPPPTATPAFEASESLDDRSASGCRAVASAVHGLPKVDTVLCAPDPAAQQAAQIFGLTPIVEKELAAPAYGRWAGRPVELVAREETEAVAVWLSDPHSAPHGGESLSELLVRIGGWCDSLGPGRALAVVHGGVARAAAVHALDAGPGAMMHLDVMPLGLVGMSRTGGWRLQRLGRLGRLERLGEDRS